MIEKRSSLFKNKRILLVAAHPDDVESGCGGTVAKWQHNTFSAVVFAPCLEDPLNAGIVQEYEKAMATLGVNTTARHSFPRDILEHRNQEVRDILHHLKKQFDPDIVFCPSINDLHQDHRAIASCCLTIFRDSATVLAYELVRSTVNFNPNLFVRLSDHDMKKKLAALRCYKTQYRRTYFKPAIFRGLARFRGSQLNVRFAEAFEIMRMADDYAEEESQDTSI